MSDFLISLSPQLADRDLLGLARAPYRTPPTGELLDHAWGAVAVLHDPVQLQRNVHRCRSGTLAVVGDLLLPAAAEFPEKLLRRAGELRDTDTSRQSGLWTDGEFERLNGAFALLLADKQGPAVVTDPLGSVQVYSGYDHAGNLVAIGTHPDLVALLARGESEPDPVSVFEFLNGGTPCFPHTLHAHVKELAPGCVHLVAWKGERQAVIRSHTYWPFPDEFDAPPREEDLARQLAEAFTTAVRERCSDRKVGVTLSGGLDSRLVMAAVPTGTTCIGLTFLDVVNREARTAQEVARCYGREWMPLTRDPEFIARTALDTVKFTGCEGDWVDAHGVGFTDDFARHGLGAVLTGLLMNNNIRGYYAADMRRVARGGGLLPPRFEFIPYDYPTAIKPFHRCLFPVGLQEASVERRRAFLKEHPGLKRESKAEWLSGYPFSQASDNTIWVAERRTTPIRLPAMDRRFLDIACRMPMSLKAQGRVFQRMAVQILGKGVRIRNANDGVRPGSSHVSALAQKAMRRTENLGRRLLQSLGVQLPVPHSWHDYQRYWQESAGLRTLATEHGRHLKELEGAVFGSDPTVLLHDRTLPWKYGFRLTQLAIWQSILAIYRRAASRATVAGCASSL